MFRLRPLGTIVLLCLLSRGPGCGGQPLADGDDVAGATTSTLTLQSAAAVPGQYALGTVNAVGESSSPPTDLSAALGPRLRLEPPAIEVLQGTRVRLAADVEGAAPMTFQWLRDGEPLRDEAGLSGVLSTAIEFEAVEPSQAGRYQLTARNPHGATVISLVDLTVCNVRGWGTSRYGQSLLPLPFRGIRGVSTLMDHVLALSWDGSVKAWGDNGRGECEVPLA